MEPTVVGMDIGNTFLRVYFANRTIIMYNSLLLEKGNIFINKKPTNHCLVDVNLLTGFKFDDPTFQIIAKYYNYAFRRGQNRAIVVKLSHETAIEQFHPELALLLMLKGVFMTNPHFKYLIAQKPIKLVATVFEGDSNCYRLALSNSLNTIGVSQFSLVSTPACIAVSYLKDKKQRRDERQVISIVDFGDRGLSVVVCKIFSQQVGVVEMLRSQVSHLGGNHLTNLLAQLVVRQLSKDKGMDISRTPKIMHKLKILCDEAKQTLTKSQMAFVRLDDLPDILVYGCEVSAVQFEYCIKNALQQNIDLITNTIKDFQVTRIILSGSSCKIPAFKAMFAQQLRQYKQILCNQEWLREGIMTIKMGSVHLLDVTSFDLRIQGDENYSCLAIVKGETIPLRKQIVMKFPSGELTYSMRFFQNGLLVAFCLIPERPSESKYNLYVEVDRNKMLNIYATNNRGLIKMTCNMMDLPKQDHLRYSQLLTQVDFYNEND